MRLQRLHRLGQIGHPQIGLAFQRAAGGLGQRPGFGRRMVAAARSPRARRTPRPSAGRRPRCADRSPGPAARPAARPAPEIADILQTCPSSAAAPPAPRPDAPSLRRSARRNGADRRFRASCPMAAIASSSLSAAFLVSTSRSFSRVGIHQRIAHRMQAEQPDGFARLARAGRVPCRSPRSVSCIPLPSLPHSLAMRRTMRRTPAAGASRKPPQSAFRP